VVAVVVEEEEEEDEEDGPVSFEESRDPSISCVLDRRDIDSCKRNLRSSKKDASRTWRKQVEEEEEEEEEEEGFMEEHGESLTWQGTL